MPADSQVVFNLDDFADKAREVLLKDWKYSSIKDLMLTWQDADSDLAASCMAFFEG